MYEWTRLEVVGAQLLFKIQSVVSVSPEVLVGPLDPEHVAAAIVLVQVAPDQRPV